MSTFNEIDVECAECAHEYKGIIWTAVHASEDPVLKDLLLGGEFNILICPACARAAYQDHFVLYQDTAAELIAYIYPPAQKPEEEFLRKATLANFHEAQAIYEPKERKDYEPILVFGLATFVEMMREEDARAQQSQIAEVICKKEKIPYTLLRPSQARRLSIMRVLPGAKGGSLNRDALQGGLKRLLAINPALERYGALLRTIDSEPGWSL